MSTETRPTIPARTKSLTKHEAQRGWLKGYGPTKAEAKQSLEAAVDRALKGSYSPVLVRCGPITIMVWRDPTGFQYSIMHDSANDGIHEPSGCAIGFESMGEAIRSAASHAFSIGVDLTTVRTDSDIPLWVEGTDRRDNIIGLGRFQRAYRWAKQNQPDGIQPDNDNDLHRWACDHSSEFA
jgi:hypothetical protein